jgi:hypothetical protein
LEIGVTETVCQTFPSNGGELESTVFDTVCQPTSPAGRGIENITMECVHQVTPSEIGNGSVNTVCQITPRTVSDVNSPKNTSTQSTPSPVDRLVSADYSIQTFVRNDTIALHSPSSTNSTTMTPNSSVADEPTLTPINQLYFASSDFQTPSRQTPNLCGQSSTIKRSTCFIEKTPVGMRSQDRENSEPEQAIQAWLKQRRETTSHLASSSLEDCKRITLANLTTGRPRPPRRKLSMRVIPMNRLEEEEDNDVVTGSAKKDQPFVLQDVQGGTATALTPVRLHRRKDRVSLMNLHMLNTFLLEYLINNVFTLYKTL